MVSRSQCARHHGTRHQTSLRAVLEINVRMELHEGRDRIGLGGLTMGQGSHMAYRIVSEKDVGGEPRPARPNWVFSTCLIEEHTPAMP
jgi:hypothetical protein